MRILIADDHKLVRDGLRPFLEQLAPEVTIVEAGDYPEALALAQNPGQEPLGLALLDLHMPGMNGAETIGRFRTQNPDVKIVILSGDVGRGEVRAAIGAGASGYIGKTMGGSALVNALRLVLSGETYLPPSVLTGDFAADPAPDPADGASPLDSLSARERTILTLLIEGQTNKMIARALDLQEITIKVHLRNIYRKIGAANRAQAVRIAMSSGWTC